MATCFSTAAAAQLAGVTYRQADYWCRHGVLDPENNGAGSGAGKARVWSPEDVALLRVCGRLAEVGAGVDVLTRVCATLRRWPMVTWAGRVFVTREGAVHTDEARMPAGWVVDLSAAVGDLPVA